MHSIMSLSSRRLGVLAGVMLVASTACGSKDKATKPDAAEFCRIHTSIAAEAMAAGRTDPAAVIAVFRSRLADIDRGVAVAPADVLADSEALAGATRAAVEGNDITKLIDNRDAMAARSAIDSYCAARP
jgi:hypothetical protein